MKISFGNYRLTNVERIDRVGLEIGRVKFPVLNIFAVGVYRKFPGKIFRILGKRSSVGGV
jgi:hypothetical protein